MTKRTRAVLWIAFVVYSAVMLWLLFGNWRVDAGLSWWEEVRRSLNLVPLRTIGPYLAELFRTGDAALRRHAFINLFGNIGTFIPLGFFLPCLWKRMRSPRWLLGFSAALIALAEVLQLFTLTGSCDIDDPLLNLPGVLLGYCLFLLLRRPLHA